MAPGRRQRQPAEGREIPDAAEPAGEVELAFPRSGGHGENGLKRRNEGTEKSFVFSVAPCLRLKPFPPSPRSSLTGLLYRLRLATAENIRQAVVALVTRVLEDAAVEPCHRELAAPRLRVERGIFDREPVEQFTIGQSRESLGDFRVRADH